MDIDLRYLEGRSAIGECIQTHTGGRPSDQQKMFAAACLLHGRLFWQSAASATLETRPLLLYYGAAAYAKALVIVLTGCQPQDIRQSHGLKCSAKNGNRIADFCIQTNGAGLFQQFNDVVASRNRIRFFEQTIIRSRIVPATASEKLANLEVSLSDCLSRIPSLQAVYELCTGTPSKVQQLQFDSNSYGEGGFGIRVDLAEMFDSVKSLQNIVSSLRNKVPFLEHWRLEDATKAWDKSVLQFENIEPGADEFGSLTGDVNHYRSNLPGTSFDPFDHLAPLAGLGGAIPAYIEGIDGQQVSEVSLVLASLFGLSSLVRYFPHIWTACVYRQSIAGNTVDDGLLPVIEQCLGDVTRRFPILVTELLLG